MGTNLASLLTDTAERDGGLTAIKLDDTEVNYGFLNDGSARVAGMPRPHATTGVGSVRTGSSSSVVTETFSGVIAA